MNPRISEEQRPALNSRPGQPVTVEDELTHSKYVLLPLDLYERVHSLFRDEPFDVTDTYAAQSAAAGAAGWDDPEMDVYSDYDAHRRTA